MKVPKVLPLTVAVTIILSLSGWILHYQSVVDARQDCNLVDARQELNDKLSSKADSALLLNMFETQNTNFERIYTEVIALRTDQRELLEQVIGCSQ